MEHYELVRQSLEILKEGLIPFVMKELKATLGKIWWVSGVKPHVDDWRAPMSADTDDERFACLDAQALLGLMNWHWNSVFRAKLDYDSRRHIGDARKIRNDLSHQHPITCEDAFRGVDAMRRLLEKAKVFHHAERIRLLAQEILRFQFVAQSLSAAMPAAQVKAAAEKPVFDATSNHKTKDALKEEADTRASFDAWLKQVAAMSANAQVGAVATKLMERNPGFDGKVKYKTEKGIVTFLDLSDTTVSDLSPVKAMPVTSLDFGYASNLSDLLPLNGMNLTNVDLCNTAVSDLSPLKGMRLSSLDLSHTEVSDLSPLHGMPLTSLYLDGATKVIDLSPLKGMPLVDLDWSHSHMTNLSQLQGIQLRTLCISCTKVSDLSPLRDMPLEKLICDDTPVSDLSPLTHLRLTLLTLACTAVSDLSPLSGMRLTYLNLSGVVVSDLSALQGMPLTCLHLRMTKVTDLSALMGMPLATLDFSGTSVCDLSPLKGMPVTRLDCSNTPVSDLSLVKDMKLTYLDCRSTQVSDLSPLRGMPLKAIWCDFRFERDAEILRSINTLDRINGVDAKQFWKEADAHPAFEG